jgi:hypothetical protein
LLEKQDRVRHVSDALGDEVVVRVTTPEAGPRRRPTRFSSSGNRGT